VKPGTQRATNRRAQETTHTTIHELMRFVTRMFSIVQNTMLSLLPLLLVPLTLSPLVGGQEQPEASNRTIRVKAGVLHAPPFAFVTQQLSGDVQFRGFHIDLIDRLKIFALEIDNVDFQVDLSVGPPYYDSAIDVIANDCNTTVNPRPREECDAFDLILGDFFSNMQRYTRVDYTPPWLTTAVSTLQYTHGRKDVTTLKEAEAARAPVCVPKLSFLGEQVFRHIPDTVVHFCDGSGDECVDLLKNETCALFADDALLLHYRASQDPTLQVTREKFRSQYLIYPKKQSLDPEVSRLINKWIYAAGNHGTLDELYHKYFQKELCPIGTAGGKFLTRIRDWYGLQNWYSSWIPSLSL
jgi:Bacterial extracellular solute-binding proteins, family 3